jgi:hypothetical protein
MAKKKDPYVNEQGASLFDLVLDLYDRWLMDLPYVRSGRGGAVAGDSQPELVREVWPTVQQLCIRMEANGKGDLAARVERAFRNAEDYARIIDNYCESDQFDYHLWAYGDPALDTTSTVDAEPPALLAQAEEIGECELTEDLHFTAFERQWAADLGQRCAQIEVDKYGHPPRTTTPHVRRCGPGRVSGWRHTFTGKACPTERPIATWSNTSAVTRSSGRRSASSSMKP